MTWRVLNADCVEAMAGMDADSVDAIVTDPPYGLEFMGKEWDRLAVIADDPASVGGFQDGNGGNPYSRSRIRYATGGTAETVTGEGTDPSHPFADGRRRVRYGQGGHSMQEWHYAWALEALRVLKPGGHLLAFGGTRTYHRLACAVEDAGFEVRDCLAWLYGSGFPKSLDVSKAIDKRDAAGEREERAKRSQEWFRQHITPQQVNDATGTEMGHHITTHPTQPFVPTPTMLDKLRPVLPELPDWLEALVRDRAVESANMAAREVTGSRAGSTMPGFARIANGEPTTWDETVPFTPDAERWQGWGTALKPAFEPIIMARKPLVGTVAANVLEYGTGALNVDGTRIEGDGPSPAAERRETGRRTGKTPDLHAKYRDEHGIPFAYRGSPEVYVSPRPGEQIGRWPANVVLDPEAAAMLDEQTGERTSPDPRIMRRGATTGTSIGGNGKYGTAAPHESVVGYGDTGGASRFFYTAKTSRSERENGRAYATTDDGHSDFGGMGKPGAGFNEVVHGKAPAAAHNNHPTVKPLELMRWLVRLVTPPGGTVLDPFLGSGTTVIAALREGFDAIGIEQDPAYVDIARARIVGDSPLFNAGTEVV